MRDYLYYLLKYGNLEFKKAAFFILKKHYKIKQSLTQNYLNENYLNQQIDSFIQKLNKETKINKLKTIYSELETLISVFNNVNFYNTKIKPLKKEKLTIFNVINYTIADYHKKITYTHQYFLNKQKNDKEYIMATFFLKSLSHLKINVEKLTKARTIIIETIREFLKYRDIKMRYLAIPELSKSNHPHLHIFIYHQISKEDTQILEQRIAKKLKHLTKEYDIKLSSIKIDNKDNYSNPLNNIIHKMGQNIQSNKINYFLFIKAFAKKRFITNSKIENSFYKLKKMMKIFNQTKVFEKIKVSYHKLNQWIEDKSEYIKLEVKDKFVTLHQFILNIQSVKSVKIN